MMVVSMALWFTVVLLGPNTMLGSWWKHNKSLLSAYSKNLVDKIQWWCWIVHLMSNNTHHEDLINKEFKVYLNHNREPWMAVSCRVKLLGFLDPPLISSSTCKYLQFFFPVCSPREASCCWSLPWISSQELTTP